MPNSYPRARDSRIISAINQARTVMSTVQANNENYDKFNCLHEDMINLCLEIENNYVEGDFDTPNIAKTTEGRVYIHR